MVNVDLLRWQWHLNGSHLFSMRCCDLWKEIKMAAFFICTVTLFLLLLGGEGGKILIWDVMHSGSVCISAILGSTFKLWTDGIFYCRKDEIDVFILIFILINCAHLMSCAAAMMWVSLSTRAMQSECDSFSNDTFHGLTF